MAIAFDCACGRHFSVGDGFAGKRTKCPSCGGPLTVPAPAPVSEEDAAYRVLMDGPGPEPAAPARADDEGRDGPAPPIGTALTSKKVAKFTKPSAAERKGRKERKRRGPRPHDPERVRKILYMIGGACLILVGVGIVFLSFEGGAIRAGLFGGAVAFGGVSTLFQGLTGNFDDDA